MAGNRQIVAPKNQAALARFRKLPGSDLNSKMSRFKEMKISPFFDNLITAIPALGKGVRTRQHAEYLLRNFFQGVGKMNEADAKIDEAKMIRSSDEGKSMELAKEADALYRDAYSHFERAGENEQAGYCKGQIIVATLLSKDGSEQKPQASARPGGVRSGKAVADGPARPTGGPAEWDWRDNQKEAHTGGLPGQG